MENTDTIRKSLMIIASKLYKMGLLNGYNYKHYMDEINNKDERLFYKLSCEFLKIALYNNAYQSLKNEFNAIYFIAVNNKPNITKLKQYLKQRLSKCNFPIFFDGAFEDDAPVNRLKIYVPINKTDLVMYELYSMHGDIYENNKDFKKSHSETLAIFNGYLKLEIYFYYITKEGNIIIKSYNKENESLNLVETIINKSHLALFFKKYDNVSRIETEEFMFLNAINGDSAADFIKAMNIKNKINLNKVIGLRTKLHKTIKKEEKNNGLQKTC